MINTVTKWGTNQNRNPQVQDQLPTCLAFLTSFLVSFKCKCSVSRQTFPSVMQPYSLCHVKCSKLTTKQYYASHNMYLPVFTPTQTSLLFDVILTVHRR